jgi:hypothetical protein
MTKPPIDLRAVLAGKAELIVHGADRTVTARALAKLLAEKCDYLFVQGGKPVIVLGEDDAPPTMRPAGVNEIIIAAHKLCQPIGYKDGQRQEITLPDKVAELYLAMPEEWRLRPLTSFASGPMLRDDGSISCEKGYDAATGVYIYNIPKITVPDQPSREDAKSALATLRRAFRTFAFADRKIVIEKMNADGETIDVEVVDLKQPPGKDESTFLTALLTAVARPSLPLAPGVVERGPPHSGSGVGKGLLAHAKSIIAHGDRAHAAVLGEHKEEFDKGLTAELLRGRQFVFIDNLNNVTLRSRVLCAVLGERDADLRRLGGGMESASPAFIDITGNGLAIAEDLVRRLITIELDAKCENPEQRKFAGDFLTDIESRRAELLQAALIIWRWGRQAKLKSKGSKPLGGFEQWTAWVRDPLVALGCQDPVARITDLKTSDPDRLATLDIFVTWWERHQDKAVKASELHDDVQALIVPDVKKRSRQNVVDKVAKLAGTQVGGFRLTSDKDDKEKGDKGYWTPLSYKLLQISKDETKSEEDTTSDSGTQAAAEGAAAHGEAEAHACAHCGRADGIVYPMKDIRRGDPIKPPPGGMPMVHLHEGCTQAFFANGSAEPGLSPGRIRELAAWYLDRATAQHEANEAGDISSAELDADLRLILREEVFPEFVEIEFERVMKAVFSEIA